jgi:hypothetical protein
MFPHCHPKGWQFSCMGVLVHECPRTRLVGLPERTRSKGVSYLRYFGKPYGVASGDGVGLLSVDPGTTMTTLR